jgi:biotin synthase-related radical SAM superfamily protein
MKKILLIAAVAFAFTACKKDYVCECTYSSTAPGSTSSTDKTTMVKVTKKVAKANCIKTTYESTSGANTYVSTRDCKIK